jgi:hypothetical protein
LIHRRESGFFTTFHPIHHHNKEYNMSPRIKWGLIAGAGVAVLNLCGGALIGALNNCIAIVTVSVAAALAGYFTGQHEPPAEAVKAGAVAGAVVGGVNLVSQLIGGAIGGFIGSRILASFSDMALMDPSEVAAGTGLGFGIIFITAVAVGILLILVGAGIGALTAKLTAPKVNVFPTSY